MVTFPNAKINLGLNILSKRDDGYHNIESCFYPVPWQDILEIVPSDTLKFSASGLPIPGSPESNLCLKAFHLLQADHDIPAVHILLHKVIPMGAGLGGGSADGAFTLKLLNDLFGLGLPELQLEKYAAQLGSDCPFFIRNEPALATGTGTDLHPFTMDLAGKYIALINPQLHVSTQEAYSQVKPGPASPLTSILAGPAGEWKAHLKNDFEVSVFPKYPRIAELKAAMYEAGAFYASMTGSGSTVYGLFDTTPNLENAVVFQLSTAFQQPDPHR